LTRKIKADPRFNGIPVVMHSSLTADANQALGKGVGADAYVPKFQPLELSATLEEMLQGISYLVSGHNRVIGKQHGNVFAFFMLFDAIVESLFIK